MLDVLVLDPGEKRCGWAFRHTGQLSTFSHGPWEAVNWFDSYIEHQPNPPDMVVLEQWVSYPHAQAGNAWRDLVEVKVLGAVEYICKKNGVNYVYQQTSLLKPTAARAQANGYNFIARNRDEKAAETHLYYFEHQQTQKDTQ